MDRTLIICKPDAVERGLVGEILARFERRNLSIVALELRSVNSPTPRVYPHLSELEYDAFHARIWSGLHFRKAMVDGYDIAHRTAERVMSAFGV